MRKILLALFGLLLLVGQSNIVRAQGETTAELSLVNVQGFPVVTALLDVFGDQGQPVTGLQAEDVTMLEDGQPHPVSKLVESTPRPRLWSRSILAPRLLSVMDRGSSASSV